MHPLLEGPNSDRARATGTGWDKERGLYFAARWDEAYEPLLAMHRPRGTAAQGRIDLGGDRQGPAHPYKPRAAPPARQADIGCTSG